MTGELTEARKPHVLDGLSDLFQAQPKLLTLLLLLPPLLWIGVVYIGSLLALLIQSFYSLDDFSGVIVHQFTLATYAQLLEEANVQIILRTGRDLREENIFAGSSSQCHADLIIQLIGIIQILFFRCILRISQSRRTSRYNSHLQ